MHENESSQPHQIPRITQKRDKQSLIPLWSLNDGTDK